MGNYIYVRVNRKTGQESHFRCAMRFTRDWQAVNGLDDATGQRLNEDPMLEVSDTRPDDYVEPTADTSVAPDSSRQAVIPVMPTDEAARQDAIKDAIGKLNVDNVALWTKGGIPQTAAIEEITGFPVSADERNAAWAEIQAAQ